MTLPVRFIEMDDVREPGRRSIYSPNKNIIFRNPHLLYEFFFYKIFNNVYCKVHNNGSRIRFRISRYETIAVDTLCSDRTKGS